MSSSKESFFRRHLHRTRHDKDHREQRQASPATAAAAAAAAAAAESATPPKVLASGQTTTGSDEPAQGVDLKVEDLSIDPKDDYSSNPNLLWDEAYDAAKGADPELLLNYERFLAAEGLEEDVSKLHGKERREKMDRLLQKSLEKTAKQDRVEGAIGQAVDIVLSVKETVGSALSAIPIAAAAWTPICVALSVFSKSSTEERENRSGIVEIVKKMKWYSSLSLLVLEQNAKEDRKLQELVPQLADHIRELYLQLLLYLIATVCAHNTSPVFRGLKRIFDDWKAKMEAVKDAETAVTSLMKQYRGENANSYLRILANAHLDEKQAKIMQALFVVDVEAEMDSLEKRKDRLLSESYQWILQTKEYRNFMDREHDPQYKLLWIKGDAGMGKTMIMIGIIRELRQKLEEKFAQPVLAYFLCQGTNSRSNNATSILKGLLWQIVRQEKSLLKHLNEQYDSTGDQFLTGNNAFFTLTKIFRSMIEDGILKYVVLVVDALDECLETQRSNEQPGLIDLLNLIRQTSQESTKIKWLVSGRKISMLEEKLLDVPNTATGSENAESRTLVIDVNPASIATALKTYIEWKVGNLRVKYEQTLKGNARPSELKRLQKQKETLDTVSDRIQHEANGTFLWVSIVFRELNSCEPPEMLKRLETMPTDLENLYARIIRRIRDSSSVESCKRIIMTVITAYRPLYIEELEMLADLPAISDIAGYLENTGLLTVREDVVYLLHQSTKDYILNSKDADISELFPTRFEDGHTIIVQRSIDLMADDLQTNIYGVEDPSMHISKIEEPNPNPLKAVRYSCSHCLDHLRDIRQNEAFSDQCALMDAFLQQHLGPWLEAICLMRHIPDILKSIERLAPVLQERKVSPPLLDLIYDIDRLIRFMKDGIENYPRQIYSSAQIFTPSQSIARSCLKNLATSAISAAPIMEHWDECLHSFPGNNAVVAISPCGGYLATARGPDIRILDLAIGSCSQTLEGFPWNVTTLGYSREGRFLASGTDTGIVKIWKMSNGTCFGTIVPHEEIGGRPYIKSVGFSPTDDHLAIASHRITIWDIHTRSIIRRIRHKLPTCVQFSTDGRSLLAASNITRLWDLETGKPLITITDRTDRVVLSPNGKQIAGTSAGALRIWDVETGLQIREFDATWLPRPAAEVAFSPDGLHLATGSRDNAVQIFNTSDKKDPLKLYGHSAQVLAVTYSSDGEYLATVSLDGCVKYWALPRKVQAGRNVIQRHRYVISQIAVSPNGQWFISESKDTIKVWDMNGQHLFDLPDIGKTARTVISPQSNCFATASINEGQYIIQLWDRRSAKCEKTFAWNPKLRPREPIRQIIAFSPPGNLIAVNSNYRIRAWNIASGTLIFTFEDPRSDSRLLQQPDALYYHRCTPFLGFNATATKIIFGHRGPELLRSMCLVDVHDLDRNVLERTIGLYWGSSSRSVPRETLLGDLSQRVIEYILSGKLLDDSLSLDSLPLPDGPMEELGLFRDDDNNFWITRNESSLLWLPPVYHPSSFAVCESTIILGCGSGYVVCVKTPLSE